jgi:hypothetical protein
MHFTDLLVLLRSKDGTAIGELELGNTDSKYMFDEVEADMRLLMPSSKYFYDSSRMSPFRKL